VSDQVPGAAVPVEAILARHTARRALYIGPLLVVVFGLTRGWEGAWASALGVAVVAGNFVLAGVMLSAAARVSPGMYHAAALFGFLARLALLVLTMLLVVQLVEIDRVAFGVTVVVAYLALLTWEAVAVSRRRERELDWVS
jgi:hypothetical protein